MSGAPEKRHNLLRVAIAAGINDPKELANMMGQAEVESQGFTRKTENFNYRAARLLEVFDGRNGLKTVEQAEAIVKNGPQGIANFVYGGEWGKKNLGNTQEGDGWNFRGRGDFQITGRANYAKYGKMIGVDLISHPELAEDKTIAAKLAVAYWKDRVVKKGHQFDVGKATGDINPKKMHLKERREGAAQWERKIRSGYLEKNLGIDINGKKVEQSQQPAGPTPNKKQTSASLDAREPLVDLPLNIQSLYGQLQTHAKQPLLAAGCSEQIADNMIAVGVKRCADRGATEVTGFAIDKADNRLLVDSNAGRFSYDAIAASKEDPARMLTAAAETQNLPERQQNLRNGLDDQLKPLLQKEGVGELLADKMIAGCVAQCAMRGAQEIRFAGIDLAHDRLVVQIEQLRPVTVDALAASKQSVTESFEQLHQQMQVQQVAQQQQSQVHAAPVMSR